MYVYDTFYFIVVTIIRMHNSNLLFGWVVQAPNQHRTNIFVAATALA